MISSDIFDITEPTPEDKGIMRYEHHTYRPENGSDINSSGDVRINITKTDLITYPSDSYLLIEGRLTKTDGTAFADAAKIALINNGLMFLFKSIKYTLSGRVIEHLNNPGQATTMLGLLKYPRGFAKSLGLNQLWYKDTEDTLTDENLGFNKRQNYIIKKPATKGSFSFIVPLKHIFGFCEDYDKVLYGFSHTLTLTRDSTDNNAIVRDGGDVGKVSLTKIEWLMPHVIPSNAVELPFLNTIKDKSEIPVAFMSRQCETTSVDRSKAFSWTLPSASAPNFPNYIIVGFQTKRDNDQEKNPAIFNHCNVTTIKVVVGGEEYPESDYELSFGNNQYARAYRDAAVLGIKLFGLNELVTDPSIAADEYKDLYPLFVFDVSKRTERLKLSSVDMRIEAKFNANVPERTLAYALIISDKICSFESDKSSLKVIE